MDKIVYVAMCADILHVGHLNIISKAVELGRVVVGLLTEEAILSYKELDPLFSFNGRREIVSNIVGVSEVIPQDTLSYIENLEKLRPDYVVHGDDWKKGVQKKIRQEVIDILAKWGGELIEIPYTKGVSSSEIKRRIRE